MGICCRCGQDRSIVRGLCYNSCYPKAMIAVRKGKTTWDRLEAEGKSLPPRNQRDAAPPLVVKVEQDRCIALIRAYLQFDNQRAVSWREVNDAIDAIRRGDKAPEKGA